MSRSVDYAALLSMCPCSGAVCYGFNVRPVPLSMHAEGTRGVGRARGGGARPTWGDGHAVLVGVASAHGPQAVQAVGGDDRVRLGQRREGRGGRGGGLRQAEGRRGRRRRLGERDAGHQVELWEGRTDRETDRRTETGVWLAC